MREKFIELPQGRVVLTDDLRPTRIESGRVTGSRYFIEIDPNDDECVFIGRKKDGVHLYYQMADLSVADLEGVRTKKQVDLLAREILTREEDFWEDDIEADEEGKRFLREEEREIEEMNRQMEREKERQLHPFQKQKPSAKVIARHARMWNSRNVRKGQLKLET
jgi:hypothetical protein